MSEEIQSCRSEEGEDPDLHTVCGALFGKGWHPGRLMMVARRFRTPIREVREVLEAQKGSHT